MTEIASPNKSIYISYVKSIEANVSALEKFLAAKGYNIFKRHLNGEKTLSKNSSPVYSLIFCMTKDYMKAMDKIIANLNITAEALESMILAKSLIENGRIVIALMFENVCLHDKDGYFAEIGYEMTRINFYEKAKEEKIWSGPLGQQLVNEIERGRKLQEKSILNFKSFIISKSFKDFKLILSKETTTSKESMQLDFILKLFEIKSELDSSRKAAEHEKDFTKILIEKLITRNLNDLCDRDLVKLSIYCVLKDSGVDVNFTERMFNEDSSLELHSRYFLTNFVNLNFYETKLKTPEFVDRLFADDYLEALFVEVFREFIARQFDVDKEKIAVMDVDRESVSVFWYSFGFISDAALTSKPVDEQDLGKHAMEYSETTSKKNFMDFLIISNDFFDSRYDKEYSLGIYEGKVELRGGMEYYLPFSWKRIGLNVRNGFKDEWCVAYLCLRLNQNKLRKNEKIANYLNEDLAQIVCFKNKEKAEKYCERFVLNEFNLNIVLQCRVDPHKVKEIDESSFLVCSFDYIMPYALLVKKS